MTRQTLLFVVPRFHTNLFFATKALKQAGFGVEVFAADDKGIEDHSFVKPHLFGRAPSRAEVEAAFGSASPDLVVLRYAWGVSDHVRALCRAQPTPVWLYNQTPLTRRLTLRNRLGLVYHRKSPERRITPVPGLDPRGRSDRHVRYLPWPVEADPDVAIQPASDGRIRILCVGKLAQRRKNHHLLLDAIEAAGLEPRVRVTLAGSSSLEIGAPDPAYYLGNLQARAQAADWLEIRPDVPFSRMPDLYAAADICVLPSNDEPLGTSPIEAMAYGAVPVISTASGSAGYVTHGTDGMRVDMSRPGDLQRALIRLVDQPEERRALSEGALRTARSELSPARFLERITDLIAEG